MIKILNNATDEEISIILSVLKKLEKDEKNTKTKKISSSEWSKSNLTKEFLPQSWSKKQSIWMSV